MREYTIRPINTGFIQVDYGVHVVSGRNPGRKVLIPSTAWLIEGGENLILVDTGMCETVRADRWHHPGSYQREGMAIHEQLAGLNIKPEDIDTVVFTHLHWDHCSNMDKFVRAEFIVQGTELEFALNPMPWYYRSYEAPALGLTAPFRDKKFTVVDGEVALADGLTLIPTPGHSPGHQSVVVNTAQGPYIIAGDAAFVKENMEGDPERMLPYLPIGRFVNFFDMWHSLERIASYRGVVLPGHDSRVLEIPVYPAGVR